MGHPFFRFLAMGAVNTLLSYLLYLVLLVSVSYQIAYSIAYCAGIVISYFLNVRFVFGKNVTLGSFLKFPAVYLCQYAVGAVTLWVMVDRMEVAPSVAMIGVMVISIPVTFWCNLRVFDR